MFSSVSSISDFNCNGICDHFRIPAEDTAQRTAIRFLFDIILESERGGKFFSLEPRLKAKEQTISLIEERQFIFHKYLPWIEQYPRLNIAAFATAVICRDFLLTLPYNPLLTHNNDNDISSPVKNTAPAKDEISSKSADGINALYMARIYLEGAIALEEGRQDLEDAFIGSILLAHIRAFERLEMIRQTIHDTPYHVFSNILQTVLPHMERFALDETSIGKKLKTDIKETELMIVDELKNTVTNIRYAPYLVDPPSP